MTTDPQRDSGPVIAAWLRRFEAGLPKRNFLGLTGTRAQIDAAQSAAHVAVAQDDGRTHSTSVLLYGPDDYARVAFTVGDQERAEIEHDLPVVASQPAG